MNRIATVLSLRWAWEPLQKAVRVGSNRCHKALSFSIILLILLGGAAARAEMLQLRDTDIRAVVEMVSKSTGRNFIIGQGVRGPVTLIASHDLEPDELYHVFLSILDVHGYAAIEADGVVKIVPAANAKADAVPTISNGQTGMGDEVVTRVIQLRNVAAAQLVPVLRPLLPNEGHLVAYPGSNVLIASDTAVNLERLVTIIRRIDQASGSDVEVVRLQHASADEVVNIVNALEQGQAQQAGTAGGGMGVRVIADPRTNSVLLSGERAARLRIKALVAHLDTPLEQSGNTRVIYLRYAKASELATVLGGVSGSIVAEQGGAPAPGSEVSIQADEATNALVITAPPAIMRDLESVVRQLDVRRAQVMVKAVIADVSAKFSEEWGVDWAYDGSSNNGPVAVLRTAPDDVVAGLASTPAIPPIGLSVGMGDTSGDNFAFGALLRALSGDGNTNILSTPTLLTMDNEEAEIVVGQNVPFVTGAYTSANNGTTGVANPFQTIEREDVGLTLKIKPQINEGDAIRLEIEQSISQLEADSGGASDLITSKRSLRTAVMVDNGQVVVLGGLMDDTLRESENKVPLLGDIPVLGWFFSSKTVSKEKRNLMIFLHPVILRDGLQSHAMASRKYGVMRAEQIQMRENGLGIASPDMVPVLPEWEEFLELPPPYEESLSGASLEIGDNAELPPELVLPAEPVEAGNEW